MKCEKVGKIQVSELLTGTAVAKFEWNGVKARELCWTVCNQQNTLAWQVISKLENT
jgi:hypothetical protein